MRKKDVQSRICATQRLHSLFKMHSFKIKEQHRNLHGVLTFKSFGKKEITKVWG